MQALSLLYTIHHILISLMKQNFAAAYRKEKSKQQRKKERTTKGKVIFSDKNYDMFSA